MPKSPIAPQCLSRRPLVSGGGLAAVLALAALLTGGCSSGMDGTSGASRRSSSSAAAAASGLYETYQTLGFRLEWQADAVMQKGKKVQFVDVFDESIVVQDTGNTVSFVEGPTGAIRWHRKIGSDLEKFFGNLLLDQRLLSVSDNEMLFFDARTGELLDRQSLEYLARTKPIIFGNMAIYGGGGGHVVGQNMTAGIRQWAYAIQGTIQAQPTAVGPYAGVISETGDVIVIDPATGRSLGRNRIFNGLDTNPVSSDELLFAAGLDQSVWAFDSFGNLVWRERTEFALREQPRYYNGELYVAIPRQGFVAFDAESGDKLWTVEGLAGHAVGIRNQRLIVQDGDRLVLVDRDRGTIVEEVTVPDADFVVMDQFEDGNLYTCSSTGRVNKFSPRR